MTLVEARSLGAEYGLDVASVEALRAGSVNSNFSLKTRSGQRFFLRVYEEQDRTGARRELSTIAHLAQLGVPTPAPLQRTNGERAAEHAGKPVGVHPWVDGDSLCLARITPRVASQLGAALARVHVCSLALSDIPEGRFRPADLLVRLEHVDRVDGRFTADTAHIRERLAHYTQLLDAAGPLPSGLIHGDLFRDNVLWQGGELSALLDFESASRGLFAYDIMVCVHAWCYGAGYELDHVGALLDGYARVRAIEPREWQLLPALGALAALRFATTRITDFSLRAAPGQPPLRDYRRFLARLAALEAGVLDSVIQQRAAAQVAAASPEKSA
jgi:homoserine kinase type II